MSAKQKDDDIHITCLDTFSMNPVSAPQAHGPFEAFCHIPADHHDTAPPATTHLLPGLHVLDLYRDSEKTELWINGGLRECLAPHRLCGWEFYSLLHTQPDGSSTLKLTTDVELLFGRPPGALHVPSMLFALVPEGQMYGGGFDASADVKQPAAVNMQQKTVSRETPMSTSTLKDQMLDVEDGPLKTGTSSPNDPPKPLLKQVLMANSSSTGPQRQLPTIGHSRRRISTLAMSHERGTENLDRSGKSIMPRLVVLCPRQVFDDPQTLPDAKSWGLFIGPRSRNLVLLNRQNRVDLNQVMLFSVDATFRKGKDLLSATARNFRAFGAESQVEQMFSESDFDPLKVHCGMTNAVVADYVDVGRDGRDDYRRFLGCCPPQFFVSLSTDNLRYLTPQEVQLHRSSAGKKLDVPRPGTIPDYPRWVVGLKDFRSEQRQKLRKYHTNYVPRQDTRGDQDYGGGIFRMLGLYQPQPGEDALSRMVSALGGCTEVAIAAAQPWNEEAKDAKAKIDARTKSPAPAPAPVSAFSVCGSDEDDPGSSIHWRHSLDLVPGGDTQTPRDALSAREMQEAEASNQAAQAAADKQAEAAAESIRRVPPRASVMERVRRWSVGAFGLASMDMGTFAPVPASSEGSDPPVSGRSEGFAKSPPPSGSNWRGGRASMQQ